MRDVICAQCETPFKTNRKTARFCGHECADTYNRGANNKRYKADGCIRPDGYRLITVDGQRVLEHRHVMEEHLGRKLESHEVVHHKDEDKLHNEISNLEILTHSSHAHHHHPKAVTDTHQECGACHKMLPFEDYDRDCSRPSGYRASCRKCGRQTTISKMPEGAKKSTEIIELSEEIIPIVINRTTKRGIVRRFVLSCGCIAWRAPRTPSDHIPKYLMHACNGTGEDWEAALVERVKDRITEGPPHLVLVNTEDEEEYDPEWFNLDFEDLRVPA